ncbi:hypothetical protein Tco_0067418 [Tanacetum coccineum]
MLSFTRSLIFLSEFRYLLSLHITAKVAGKPVSISEASIRSDLLFDDANGIDSLPNQAIFDAIQLMGYEGDLTVLTFNKALFSPPMKGKHLSRKVTPLFALMLVQPTEDEGDPSERPSKAQPTPSLAHTSEVPIEPQTAPSPRPSPFTIIPDSIPESSGGNLGGHSSNDKSLSGNGVKMTTTKGLWIFVYLYVRKVSRSSQEIQHLKAQIKKLKKQAKPVIKHHRAWMQSVSLKQRLARKRSSKKQWVHKESISKQGRKFAKENAQDVGRTRDIVEKVVYDKEKVSTDRPIVSTDGSKVSTDRQIEGTDEQIEGTDEQIESTDDPRKGTEDHTEEGSTTQATQTPTSTIFRDDETIAKVLLNMSQAKAVSREKEKGVELKDIEETDRPRPTSTRSLLTLKPLPKIYPKDKGKKKIEEGMNLKIAEEKATNEALIINYDDIKARIEADRLLAKKLQEEEREEARKENKEEESTRKRKLGTRKKMKSRKRRFIQNTSEDDSEKENDELRLHLTIAPDEEKEDDKAEHLEEINQNVVIRSNGQKRYFSTLMRVLSIFDREDLNAVYQLGDLMVMFNPDDEDKFWNSQQDWNIVSWKLYGSSGVHTLVTEAGLVIHMLVEKKYPLRKKVLLKMLELKLESKEDSTMAIELIRFVKKLLGELEPEDSDGDEEDL